MWNLHLPDVSAVLVLDVLLQGCLGNFPRSGLLGFLLDVSAVLVLDVLLQGCVGAMHRSGLLGFLLDVSAVLVLHVLDFFSAVGFSGFYSGLMPCNHRHYSFPCMSTRSTHDC